jgi:peptidoglycan L-alanyl-D-glutamate endopeptidase CwlK
MDLQVLFFEVIRSYDCIVLEGYRNQAAQDDAYARGTTTLKWPNGKHNISPSNAVDVAPYPLDWKNTKRFYHFAGFVLGVAEELKLQNKISHAIRWGGDWNSNNNLEDQTFFDLVHFELVL